MSKNKKSDPQKKVKVLKFIRDEGAYGFIEYEISEDLLSQEGKELDASQPDIFAIFINNLTKKCRDVFGI